MSCHLFEIWSYYNSDSFSTLLSLNIFYFEKKTCKTFRCIDSCMITWKTIGLEKFVNITMNKDSIWKKCYSINHFVLVNANQFLDYTMYFSMNKLPYLDNIISYEKLYCYYLTVYIQTPHVHLVTFMGGNIVAFYMSRSRL